MKTQIITLTALIVLSIAAPIYAQTNVIRAEVPFDFGVRGETLQAGEYTISQGIDNSGQRMVWILEMEDKSVVLLARSRHNPDAEDKPSLVFNRYGERYFLSSFVAPGSKIELPTSKAEKQARKLEGSNLAKGGPGKNRKGFVVVEATVD
ncbi:MAG: hypothetical protein DWQ47_07285 [Acidobacteria bacterium]|nr:MAG: hypothetical protein DWQ32_15385 [Acidobacteriota bacterium]REJ99271.1 MAG: hypothetical protein DWQ38_14590 [Acidobacteriota bacterium]REK16008.1 MAG: hypothetical protein DWQ43_03095 [Acidobacteriota bacterium]REK43689.1 MAG: hypothetical protein DWQ47_07285 [Acidobacteriota bacterium]